MFDNDVVLGLQKFTLGLRLAISFSIWDQLN